MTDPISVTNAIIQDIDKEAAKAITAATRAALEKVAEEFGLTVQVGGGVYDPVEGIVKPKVVYALADSGQRIFARYASLYGLTEADYGRQFMHKGETYLLVGINPAAPRFPIQGKRVRDGRVYKFPEALAARVVKG